MTDMEYLILYILAGCILSVTMYITSKKPLSIKEEVAAHLAIMIVWPIVLTRVGLLFFKSDKEIQRLSEELNREDDV